MSITRRSLSCLARCLRTLERIRSLANNSLANLKDSSGAEGGQSRPAEPSTEAYGIARLFIKSDASVSIDSETLVSGSESGGCTGLSVGELNALAGSSSRLSRIERENPESLIGISVSVGRGSRVGEPQWLGGNQGRPSALTAREYGEPGRFIGSSFSVGPSAQGTNLQG